VRAQDHPGERGTGAFGAEEQDQTVRHDPL
jgi:hypothetical protein